MLGSTLAGLSFIEVRKLTTDSVNLALVLVEGVRDTNSGGLFKREAIYPRNALDTFIHGRFAVSRFEHQFDIVLAPEQLLQFGF